MDELEDILNEKLRELIADISTDQEALIKAREVFFKG